MDGQMDEYRLILSDKTLSKYIETLRHGSWARRTYEKALVGYERERDSRIAYS